MFTCFCCYTDWQNNCYCRFEFNTPVQLKVRLSWNWKQTSSCFSPPSVTSYTWPVKQWGWTPTDVGGMRCKLLTVPLCVFPLGGVYLSQMIHSKARLFTRNIRNPGATFEYVLFFNSEEQKCVGIFQAGHLLEGPPGWENYIYVITICCIFTYCSYLTVFAHFIALKDLKFLSEMCYFGTPRSPNPATHHYSCPISHISCLPFHIISFPINAKCIPNILNRLPHKIDYF